MLIYAHIVR